MHQGEPLRFPVERRGVSLDFTRQNVPLQDEPVTHELANGEFSTIAEQTAKTLGSIQDVVGVDAAGEIIGMLEDMNTFLTEVVDRGIHPEVIDSHLPELRADIQDTLDRHQRYMTASLEDILLNK